MKYYWIFHSFEQKGINPFEAGLLQVTATPMREEYYDAKDLVKWNSNGIYTASVVNSSFEFTFLKQPISFIKCKVLSRGGSACSPIGLSLEASFDGVQYDTHYFDEEYLCGNYKCGTEGTEKTYNVRKKAMYRFVRMIQVKGECADGAYKFFGLKSIDFYVENILEQCTVGCRRSIKFITIITLLLC